MKKSKENLENFTFRDKKEILNTHLEEFKVLHNQVLERSRIQQRLLAVVATLSVAVIGFMGSKVIGASTFFTYDVSFCLFLLLISFPFYAIILLYSFNDRMIGITVGYIKQYLRERVKEVLNSNDIWRNENYFKHARRRRFIRFLEWLGTYGLLYFFPIIILIFAILYIIIHYNYMELYMKIISIVLIIFNVGICIVSIFGTFQSVELPDEQNMMGWDKDYNNIDIKLHE